jgi:hypothetical protein
LTDSDIKIRLNNIKLHFCVSAILILIVITLPILAYQEVLKPTCDPGNIWFQRSGSFMTMICVLLDACALKINAILNPPFAEKFFDIAKNGYATLHRIIVVFAILLTIGSTFIWGYGDLVIDA